MVVLQLMRCPCHTPVKPNDSLSGLAYRKLTDLHNLQNERRPMWAGRLPLAAISPFTPQITVNWARLRSAAPALGLRAGLTLSQSTARLMTDRPYDLTPPGSWALRPCRIGHSDCASVALEFEYVAPLTGSCSTLGSRGEDDWVPICQNA